MLAKFKFFTFWHETVTFRRKTYLQQHENRFKTVERAQLNIRHQFWSKLAEIRPMGAFSVLIWVKFGQFRKISTNLDNIRPKSVAEIQLRAFGRF
jgi:hypothetical protein